MQRDEIAHLLIFSNKMRHCKMPGCKGAPKIKCFKYNIELQMQIVLQISIYKIRLHVCKNTVAHCDFKVTDHFFLNKILKNYKLIIDSYPKVNIC